MSRINEIRQQLTRQQEQQDLERERQEMIQDGWDADENPEIAGVRQSQRDISLWVYRDTGHLGIQTEAELQKHWRRREEAERQRLGIATPQYEPSRWDRYTDQIDPKRFRGIMIRSWDLAGRTGTIIRWQQSQQSNIRSDEFRVNLRRHQWQLMPNADRLRDTVMTELAVTGTTMNYDSHILCGASDDHFIQMVVARRNNAIVQAWLVIADDVFIDLTNWREREGQGSSDPYLQCWTQYQGDLLLDVDQACAIAWP